MSNDQDQELYAGLLALLKLSDEPMVLSDPSQADTPIIAVNAAFLELTGYAEADVVGRNCRFLQGPKTDRDTMQRMGDALRAGLGCVQWVINYRRNGSMFWNLLFISPVHGADGRLKWFFANQHDLSGEAPLDMAQFTMGPAHMPAPQQAEFHALVSRLGQDGTDVGTMEARLASVRQSAMLSRELQATA